MAEKMPNPVEKPELGAGARRSPNSSGLPVAKILKGLSKSGAERLIGQDRVRLAPF